MNTIDIYYALILLALSGLLAAPYVLYPLYVLMLPSRRFKETKISNKDSLPSISVLIPAHNEELCIREKLENTLRLQYPKSKIEIWVCSDGSVDETDKIIESFADQGVGFIRNHRRRGKAETINRLVENAKGKLCLLTDAACMLEADVAYKLASAFDDPEVGIAGARYCVVEKGVLPSPEQGYWSLDAKLKRKEAQTDVLLGIHGAAYMARKDLLPSLAPETINDDFVIPALIRSRGARIKYVADACGFEEPTDSWKTIYHRLVRIARGNWQMFWFLRVLFNPFKPRLAIAFFMRKFLKALGPLFLGSLLYLASALQARHWTFLVFALGIWALFLTGTFGMLFRSLGFQGLRLTRGLAYGLMGQVAALVGLTQWILRVGTVKWKRAPENEPLMLDKPASPPLSVLIIKRFLDLLGACIGLVTFFPFMVLIALLVKITSPGPALFRQQRVRYNSQGEPTTFWMLKFRTMTHNAEAKSGPVWAAKNDPRITRLGKLMRRCRLDELPQFINVLKGEMSLVGPRPERPHFVELLEKDIPLYSDRVVRLKPGITGLAQVRMEYDSSVEDVRSKLLFDLTYAAHLYKVGSYLRMEFRVLWATIATVIAGRGAH